MKKTTFFPQYQWCYLSIDMVLFVKSYALIRLEHNFHNVIYDILQSNI